jgi:IS66 C-terminal element
MNEVDPQARLTDVLIRIAAHPVHRLDELLHRGTGGHRKCVPVRLPDLACGPHRMLT